MARGPVLDVRLAGRRGAGVRRQRRPRSRHPRRRAALSIDWLTDGQLVVSTPNGVVTGTDLTPYGATGQPFNEMVVDNAGRVWVNMPGSRPGEESKPGLVAVVLPDGSSRRVAGDVWFPNGMAILDDDTLVLAESHADRLTVWTISEAGDLIDRRVWADLEPGSAPTESARTPTERSGTPASPNNDAPVRAGREVLATVGADRGVSPACSAVTAARTLYIVANRYDGASGASEGIVLTHPVDVARAGRP